MYYVSQSLSAIVFPEEGQVTRAFLGTPLGPTIFHFWSRLLIIMHTYLTSRPALKISLAFLWESGGNVESCDAETQRVIAGSA
jgi:hypothetical protein